MTDAQRYKHIKTLMKQDALEIILCAEGDDPESLNDADTLDLRIDLLSYATSDSTQKGGCGDES